MLQGTDLISYLDDTYIDLILGDGEELKIPAGGLIIKEGTLPDALYILMSGVASVSNSTHGAHEIAQVEPGELLGEISFMDNCAATASVTALKDSTVLAISRETLEQRLETEQGFSSRFYRTLADVLAKRMRSNIAQSR